MKLKQGQNIPAEISPDILDTIGKSFRFRHSKGISEWLKNSLDNYLRLRHSGQEKSDGNWPILISAYDTKRISNGPNLAVIDFGGTNSAALKDFFLFWGSREAASHGKTGQVEVTGGHGNGGKFYMREMWKDGARFFTYRDSHFSSLVVTSVSKGSTGFWEAQDLNTDWKSALQLAMPSDEGLLGGTDIITYIEDFLPQIASELDHGDRGFTVLVGRRAKQLNSANDVVTGSKWNVSKLIDAVRDEPQARRPIRESTIAVLHNGHFLTHKLSPISIDPDPNWDERTLLIPAEVLPDESWRPENQIAGSLRIQKSAVQLNGRLKDLNTLDVSDERGNPIARYPLLSLPFPGSSTGLGFFAGEMTLEFSNVDELVENDREQLIRSETANSLIDWATNEIWKVVSEFDETQRSTERNQELQKATLLNDALNDHAKQFLEELQSEILVDYFESDEGGGLGDEGEGLGGVGKGSGGDGNRERGAGGSKGQGGTEDTPGSSRKKQAPKFPDILLSGTDQDPANPGQSKYFTDRHPPLEQDDLDKAHNVWWINTSHPFATEALKHGGSSGHAFKSHQLFMFRDVVQREALRYLQRRESELALDRVENELNEASNRFLAELPIDLLEQLLE